MLRKVCQLFHWGPILALGIIFFISWMTIQCDLMFWPLDTPGGLANMAVFLLWNFLTLYNYFLAAFRGPGFVPFNWRPVKPEHCQKLQYCELCEGYKSPRSHHCRKCDRCVMKMDHHCPWINTCCGHFNHGNFVYFLFFAPIGCIHALCILLPSVYKALNFPWYLHHGDRYNLVYLPIIGLLLCLFAIGLAIGVIIAVGVLFVVQFKSILRNETGIESWINEKAEARDRDENEPEDWVYPYDLGRWNNLKQVFTWSGHPVSDGFTWDVAKGCDQFTFTEEQLKQKAVKRDRTLDYVIVDNYTGTWFPLTKGFDMCCGIPCTDEPRIKVTKGDIVRVTRWKKKWMYGTKQMSEEERKAKARRQRGWFPRKCAKELVDPSNGEPGDVDNTDKKHQ